MRKALSGLDSNNRHGSGTYEKMRMSAAYISNLQNCISNMSELLVSSMLPQQRAAVQRFLSDVRRKVARSSEAEKVIHENYCEYYLRSDYLFLFADIIRIRCHRGFIISAKHTGNR